MHISASIMACPPLDIRKNLETLVEAGVNSIHYDVMDGHYVDAISGSCVLCETIAESTDLPVYVHLMVDNPRKQIEQFAKSGAKAIAFHPVTGNSNELIEFIKSFGLKAGIAVANDNEISFLSSANGIDHVIVMTVMPGKCGQDMLPEMTEHMAKLRAANPDLQIFVDGGVNDKTLFRVREADAFVIGSYLFRAPIKEQVKKLRRC